MKQMLKNVHIWKINPIAWRNQSAPDGVEYTTDYILFLGSHTMHPAFEVKPGFDRLQGSLLQLLRTQAILLQRYLVKILSSRQRFRVWFMASVSLKPVKNFFIASQNKQLSDLNLLSNTRKFARIEHVLFERDSKNEWIQWSRFFTHNRQIRDVCDNR